MCTEHWPSRQAEQTYFLLVNVLLGYIGPLIVISGCYAVIWHKVAHRHVPGERQRHEQHLARNRLKVGTILNIPLHWIH